MNTVAARISVQFIVSTLSPRPPVFAEPVVAMLFTFYVTLSMSRSHGRIGRNTNIKPALVATRIAAIRPEVVAANEYRLYNRILAYNISVFLAPIYPVIVVPPHVYAIFARSFHVTPPCRDQTRSRAFR